MTNRSPGPGALAQAALREERWREVETSGGMLSDQDVKNLDAATRSALIGVQRPRGMRYPRFQLVAGHDGMRIVSPAWTLLQELLAPAGWSDEFTLLWTLAPNAYLDGRSPTEEIQDHPDDVTDALRYAVERAIPSGPALAPHTRQALGELLLLADMAARLVERGRAAYDSDEALRFAAEAILHRIGSAVARLDAEFLGAHPSVHWRQMLGTNDALTSDWGTDEAIWTTLEMDLPGEAAQVRRILRETP